MFNFIQKLIYWMLSSQEKLLRKNARRNLKTSYSNSTSKAVFGKAASANFTIQTEKNKEKLKMGVENILKRCENNPNKLLAFIRKNGTCVYKIPFADKFLKVIGYEEGFIGRLSGVQALYLNILTSVLSGQAVNISFKTEPMFVLRDLPVDCYCMIQQFHKWYAMKLNLPGFESEAQENFQKFLNSTNADTKSLSVDEILGLKEAIARDREAIDFVINLARTTDGSKKAMQKLTTGGASV